MKGYDAVRSYAGADMDPSYVQPGDRMDNSRRQTQYEAAYDSHAAGMQTGLARDLIDKAMADVDISRSQFDLTQQVEARRQ